MKRILCIGCVGLVAVLQGQAQLGTTPIYDEQAVQPNFVDIDASLAPMPNALLPMPGGLPLFTPRVAVAWAGNAGGVIPFDQQSPNGFVPLFTASYGAAGNKQITFTDMANAVVWKQPIGPVPISAAPGFNHALHLNLQQNGPPAVWGWAPTFSLSTPGESVSEIGFTVLADPSTPQIVNWSVSLQSGAVVPVAVNSQVSPWLGAPLLPVFDTFFGYTAPANDPIVGFNLSVTWPVGTLSDAMYIDDLAFITVPEPNDAALLLAFGLAGYACRRRRAAIGR